MSDTLGNTTPDQMSLPDQASAVQPGTTPSAPPSMPLAAAAIPSQESLPPVQIETGEPTPAAVSEKPIAVLPDAKILLDAANKTAEKVSTLHLTFLALCAYVLVTVFSTTDMDLLIGKGVKLPIVDVEVPITGFYFGAPYLVVLAHFNLLLQLQLLSRKLFAFDEAASKDGAPTGLHDQLHTFPFNYYLVGKPSSLIKKLISFMATATILLLPLLALLTLQARFLAYQDAGITWAQRVAIWFDAGLLFALWPVILDRLDNWQHYMTGARQHICAHWVSWLWGLLGVGAMMVVPTDIQVMKDLNARLGIEPENLTATQGVSGVRGVLFLLWIFVTLLVMILRNTLRLFGHGCSVSTQGVLQIGIRGLVAVAVLGILLPFFLTIDGEAIDFPKLPIARLAFPLRSLDVHEGRIFAKPMKPDTIADLRSEDAAKRTAAMNATEPVDLQNRNLRHANFIGAILPQADLRGADLRGADMSGAFMRNVKGSDSTAFSMSNPDSRVARFESARLTGADLRGANLEGGLLQGADLSEALLQGASLYAAVLQGGALERTALQGVNLRGAKLQGADLTYAFLQGADLRGARLQGASLVGANLRGANLQEAGLQGANLSAAILQGASFMSAQLYSESLETSYYTAELDAVDVEYEPLHATQVQQLKESALGWSWTSEFQRDAFIQAIDRASFPELKPPGFVSCVRSLLSKVDCGSTITAEEYQLQLLTFLENFVACVDSDVARGLLYRAYNDLSPDDHMRGFASHLVGRLNAEDVGRSCPGVAALSDNDKQFLHRSAEKERIIGPGSPSSFRTR